ncbi:unnamed protein product, partial [Prunus brigantina]
GIQSVSIGACSGFLIFVCFLFGETKRWMPNLCLKKKGIVTSIVKCMQCKSYHFSSRHVVCFP